ncbi:hypothetical protein VSAL_p320_09 (plasmid) [Aliivibrio salmonicida LFI1238]|uniref:Uncharacterized protein n=1 Tax=Aliivibrio salmonicida (strain LFI1238) TaxID=316275 RepID=B6ET52_ALISL|nr:hypothetical protein [Aliivibrio salmonicida]CAQ81940.1 hypothetical protein VSAL_p320_09 [Aliivibrio salmonicida LFI1238]
MSVFKINYLNNEKTLLCSETILMKGLPAAKRSSSSMGTVKIEIYDIAENLLTSKELGKWTVAE